MSLITDVLKAEREREMREKQRSLILEVAMRVIKEVEGGGEGRNHAMRAVKEMYQKMVVDRVEKGGRVWKGVVEREGREFMREWGEAMREGKRMREMGVLANFLDRMRRWCGKNVHTYVMDIMCDERVEEQLSTYLEENKNGGEEWDWMGEEEGVRWVSGKMEWVVREVRKKRGKGFKLVYGARKPWESSVYDRAEEVGWGEMKKKDMEMI